MGYGRGGVVLVFYLLFKKTQIRKLLWSVSAIFITMNIVAFFHAYKFTHFSIDNSVKTNTPSRLTAFEKIRALAFGVNNPRPENDSFPKIDFKTIVLQSNKKIECWYIPTSATDRLKHEKGTVVICHGYGGDKSSMLDKADIFDSLGYNVMLIDFMGAGGSEGNQTTIGYKEAKEVATVFEYLKQQGEKRIFLFGTSMGAVAIMRAIAKEKIAPESVILECPFGTMYETVCMRFKNMNAPCFPMAGLLVFWGGVQNGYWAFDHNPQEYAKKINCRVLLLSGGKDKNVSLGEIERIYTNLKGNKTLRIYPEAGHENYLIKYRSEWKKDIAEFLE